MLRFEDELAKIMIPSSNTACFEDELRDNEKEEADSFESASSVYPRSESNRDRQNRNLKFYPLNYRGIRLGIANLAIFAHFASNLAEKMPTGQIIRGGSGSGP